MDLGSDTSAAASAGSAPGRGRQSSLSQNSARGPVRSAESMPAAIESAGLPDARAFPHAFGDTDYTLRLHASGYPVTLVGDATAKALPNNPSNHASWFVGETTAGRLWGDLGRKTSYAYLPAHWRFCTRHWGWRGAAACGWLLAKRVPATAVLLTIPRSWRRALWGKRSSAWETERLIREETGR